MAASKAVIKNCDMPQEMLDCKTLSASPPPHASHQPLAPSPYCLRCCLPCSCSE